MVKGYNWLWRKSFWIVLKGVWFLKYGYFVVFSFYVDNGKKKVGYVVVVMKFIMKLIIYCYC